MASAMVQNIINQLPPNIANSVNSVAAGAAYSIQTPLYHTRQFPDGWGVGATPPAGSIRAALAADGGALKFFSPIPSPVQSWMTNLNQAGQIPNNVALFLVTGISWKWAVAPTPPADAAGETPAPRRNPATLWMQDVSTYCTRVWTQDSAADTPAPMIGDGQIGSVQSNAFAAIWNPTDIAATASLTEMTPSFNYAGADNLFKAAWVEAGAKVLFEKSSFGVQLFFGLAGAPAAQNIWAQYEDATGPYRLDSRIEICCRLEGIAFQKLLAGAAGPGA